MNNSLLEPHPESNAPTEDFWLIASPMENYSRQKISNEVSLLALIIGWLLLFELLKSAFFRIMLAINLFPLPLKGFAHER